MPSKGCAQFTRMPRGRIEKSISFSEIPSVILVRILPHVNKVGGSRRGMLLLSFPSCWASPLPAFNQKWRSCLPWLVSRSEYSSISRCFWFVLQCLGSSVSCICRFTGHHTGNQVRFNRPGDFEAGLCPDLEAQSFMLSKSPATVPLTYPDPISPIK
jgi:hypothetical protein